MSKWEESIKNRLDGYESPLPEGGLEDFRSRRLSTGEERPVKRARPLPWLLGTAVAAGVTALLVLNKPAIAPEGIETIERPQLAQALESASPADQVQEQPEITASLPGGGARVNVPSDVGQAIREANQATKAEVPAQEEPEAVEENTHITEQTVPEQTDRPEAAGISPGRYPDSAPEKKINMRLGTAAGSVIGLGAIGGLAAVLPSIGRMGETASNVQYTDTQTPGGETQNPGGDQWGNTPLVDRYTGNSDHSMPLRLGVSVRVPVADRLHVTSGIEYSLYSSTFEYSLSGDKRQLAHYVGVPLRLDWTLTSGKRLDAYLGAGFMGDVCVGATLDGRNIQKDGFSLSGICGGGLQLNMTNRLGLYVDPSFSYTFPWGKRPLSTYRSDHPLMFSVSCGLRLNLGE